MSVAAVRAGILALALSANVSTFAKPALITGQAVGPAAMITLADADPRRSHKGLYRIVVRAAAKPGRITFLNSETNYQASGNITFSLAPTVAAKLADRLGKPAEIALIGRSVTVSGILVRAPIVNVLNQRARSFNRWAYQVRVENISQIEAIDG